MTTRIYVIISVEEKRLVEASSAAQAIRHCVKNKYAAKAATPKEIAQYMSAGMTVERASDDTPTIPPQTQSAQAQQTNSQQ